MIEPRGRLRFRRRHRLLKTPEFKQVRHYGTRVATRLLILYLRENDGVNARLGVVASKKVGNAVRRNRCKRLVREVFRINRHLFPEATDIVAIVKRKRVYPGYQAYESDFISGVNSVSANTQMDR